MRYEPFAPQAPVGASVRVGAVTGAAIVAVDHVFKHFTTPDGSELPVLEDINLTLHEGEIVALLGKSGSGKSTLLRCIAGLISPTQGTVTYRGTPLNGANPGVAMVFQSFALLPWLNVRANVELGLEARGVEPGERRTRAEQAIDRIGLDGFESAYPKELSGGMRQRVGFARALVVEPDALLMDEPFSALDVLTAENLRTELLTLWSGRDFPTKAILIVTHNIEEAVQMADRIFVLSSNPGRLRAAIVNEIARPRDRRSPEFEALVDKIYAIMTAPPGSEKGAPAPKVDPATASPIELPLPHASVGGLAGLLEILRNRGGRDELPELADLLTFEVDDLLPLVDAAHLLGFANIDKVELALTPLGDQWVGADILTSKEIFAGQALQRAPLVRAIVRALEATDDGTVDEQLFLDLLGRGFTPEEARAQLDTAIQWGRYGELFEYDSVEGQLLLPVADAPTGPPAPAGVGRVAPDGGGAAAAVGGGTVAPDGGVAAAGDPATGRGGPQAGEPGSPAGDGR
ncbi:MAG TPA: nitrate/sulfonate/bicarbonate ABC transporter ATP-binding protein [Acidimicrobiales bacterium]|jgi:NitT/TauT family transport system ATP-binding protein|nr:nitrate/sulfonate/bicarbonate ABC transporter ATP-binding protein [Acidimicrobiales bacterium]